MTNNSAFIQIATWNDFGEGTIVDRLWNMATAIWPAPGLSPAVHADQFYLYQPMTWPWLFAFTIFAAIRKLPDAGRGTGPHFTNIVTGKLDSANRQLWGMETSHR